MSSLKLKELERKYGDHRGLGYGKQLTEHFGLSFDSVQIGLNANTIVIGGPGTGKSYNFTEPNIARAEGYSFVSLDTDGNQYDKYRQSLEGRGYKVQLLDTSKIFESEPIDFEYLGELPMAVFVKVDRFDEAAYPVIAQFFEHLMNTLIRVADLKHKGSLPFHVELFLNEFCNFPILRGKFPMYLSCARARNISVSIIIQSLSQLKMLDPETWEIELNNCDSILYLGACDPFTLSYLSKLCGKDSKDHPVKTEHEIARMSRDSALCLIRGEAPVIDRKLSHK